MCGISGVFHYGGGAADSVLLERQAWAMRHRGPDGAGTWVDGDVAFAHRRLAILDLSPTGSQPMANEDESVWVVYSGELYDWPDLAPGLVARGHRLRGTSDTEALLHLYEEYGDEMFSRLRGMFAFGLFDRRRRRLVLGRDRFGVKPLYYHDDGRRLVFASELKGLMLDPSIPREIDECAVADYLSYQYVAQPRTIWRGVRKLPAAHRLICDANGARLERYWQLPTEVDAGHPEDWYRERLTSLLREAVRLRLHSDVPLGAFLSGGLDSSVVVALMQQVAPERVKTFTIGFEEEDFTEVEHARQVARHLGTEHHELVVKAHALELLPTLIWQMDEPHADASMIPMYYLAQMARRHVTVSLSGDGGDETFGGYSTYAWARRYAALDFLPAALRRGLARPAGWMHPDHPLGRKLRRVAMDVGARHLHVEATFPPLELAAMLTPELRAAVADYDAGATPRAIHRAAAAGLGEIPALLPLDAQTYLVDDVMAKVDRTTMIHSLESREPLLDHPLQEFAARIPFHLKLRGNVGKWILRECARPLLPPEIVARGKQGFGVPLVHWFGGGFSRLAREVLLDPVTRRRGWLDTAAIERQLGDSGSRDERRTRQTWVLVCLELWARTYLDRPREELGAPLASLRPSEPS